LKKAISNTTTADRVLFLFLIMSSIAGLLYTREALSKGSEVVIEVNGRPCYTLSLDVDKEVSVEGTRSTAVVEIKDGKVRMKESQCDNHICIKQGWMARGTIVCLPNNIVILIGTGTPDHIDAITG
jgi:hypothetical protein